MSRITDIPAGDDDRAEPILAGMAELDTPKQRILVVEDEAALAGPRRRRS